MCVCVCEHMLSSIGLKLSKHANSDIFVISAALLGLPAIKLKGLLMTCCDSFTITIWSCHPGLVIAIVITFLEFFCMQPCVPCSSLFETFFISGGVRAVLFSSGRMDECGAVT